MHISELMSESIGASELWPSDHKFLFIWTWICISGLIGIIALPVGMIAIGFTADGVAALSMAACCQSCWYGAFTGTDFYEEK